MKFRFDGLIMGLIAVGGTSSNAVQAQTCPPQYTSPAGAVGPIDYMTARQTCADKCNADGYCCTVGYGGNGRLPCNEGCHIAFFSTTLQECYDECSAAAKTGCMYTHSRHPEVGRLGWNPAWMLSSGAQAVKKCGGSERCGCPYDPTTPYNWGPSNDSNSDSCKAGCDIAWLQSDMYHGADVIYDERSGLDEAQLSDSMNKLNGHITGSSPLDASDIDTARSVFELHSPLLPTGFNLMSQAFDLMDAFETSSYGPLFANSGPFSRNPSATSDGKELERAMLQIQQAILDKVYDGTLQEFQSVDRIYESIIEPCADFLQGRKWQTAAYFPGSVAQETTEPTVVHSIDIDASMPECWGRPVAFCDQQLIRPTGLYVQAGGIVQVTVPSSVVAAGSFKIQVGASIADLQKKKFHRRNDRITTTFDVKQTTTYVANPLGGGIYIRVPYLSSLGTITISVTGDVVPASFFRTTDLHTTTESEWSSELQTAPGAWADLETSNLLLQVPRSWMYNYGYSHFQDLAKNYTLAMDGVSELLGFPPGLRNNYVLYLMPDLYLRGSVFSIGYPQVNNLVSTDANGPKVGRHSSPGQSEHHLVTKPAAWYVEFHELGHAQKFTKYRGEGEATVNLLHVYVMNVKFGVDLDKAFIDSVDGNFSIDAASINWMITENFRNDNEMDTSGSPRNEIRYQHRGYAKYADIARLYGWQVLSTFYNKEHLNHMGGTEYPINAAGADADDRTLRLSIEAGEDLTPLIHFWGIHPYDPINLKARMLEHGLTVSNTLVEQLTRYADLVPADQAAFAAHFDEVHPGKRGCTDCCTTITHGCGWYAHNYPSWNEDRATETVDAVYRILDLYPTASSTPSNSPSSFPSGAPSQAPTALTTVYEAEDASAHDAVSLVKSSGGGYTGTGYIDMGGAGSYIEWSDIDGGVTGGECFLKFTYALGQAGPRPSEITLNGQLLGTVKFPLTASWYDWQMEELATSAVCLPGPVNTVRLTSIGNGPNVNSLEVELHASDVEVSSPPSMSPLTGPAGLYEAEDASAFDPVARITSYNAGYTGTGYIDMGGAGSYIIWTGVDGGSVSGQCILTFRYTVGQAGPRPCDITVNGLYVGIVNFAKTASWADWEVDGLQASVPCLRGRANTIQLEAVGGHGGPNVDHLFVETLSSRYEAEDAGAFDSVSRVRSGNVGYTGTGYIDMGGQGSWVEWTGVDGGTTGRQCLLKFTYSVAKAAPRKCDVTVNGQFAGTVNFQKTASWTVWEVNGLLSSVSCQPGPTNTVRITATTSLGGPNLDNLEVELSADRRRQLIGQDSLVQSGKPNANVLPPFDKPKMLKESAVVGTKNTQAGRDLASVVAKNHAARDRWNAHAPLNYNFEYERDISVPEELRGPFEVQVRKGTIERVVYKGNVGEEIPVDIIADIPTIEDFFESTQKECNNDISGMDVEFHEEIGHPKWRSVTYLDMDDEEGKMSMEFIRNVRVL